VNGDLHKHFLDAAVESTGDTLMLILVHKVASVCFFFNQTPLEWSSDSMIAVKCVYLHASVPHNGIGGCYYPCGHI